MLLLLIGAALAGQPLEPCAPEVLPPLPDGGEEEAVALAAAPPAATASRWTPAGYLDAMRRGVTPRWKARIDALHLPLASLSPRNTTIIALSLDQAGVIRMLCLRRSSGVAALDQAVAEAFYDAHPFGMPPSELVREDGAALIDRLAFTVQVGTGATAQPTKP